MNLIPELPTRRKRPAHALSLGDVPPGLRVFLNGVANFFTRTVNLEQQSQAVAQSTFLKARERMLCKCINREWHFSELSMYVTFTTPCATWLYFCLLIAGYLGFLRRYLGMELQPEVFLRVWLMEQYFNFLRVSGSFFSPHHKVKVWVIVPWAHIKSTCWLPLKHIKAAAMTIRTVYFLLLFKGLQLFMRMWFKKTISAEILRSSCVQWAWSLFVGFVVAFSTIWHTSVSINGFCNSIFASNAYAFLGHSRLLSCQNRINATVPFLLQSLFLNSWPKKWPGLNLI